MMERCIAVVDAGVVSQVLICDPNDTATINHFNAILVPEGVHPAIGWSYDGVNFTAPPKTAEQLAAEAQAAKDAAEKAQAKADATIQYLVKHTPAEIDAKVRQLVGAANVTNLATAQASISAIEDLLVRMAIAVSVTAGRQLR